MARFVYHQRSPAKAILALSKPWVQSLGLWGVGVGAAALLLLSVTPLVKREVLIKVPVLSLYFEDKTPASDKPF